VTKQRQMFCHQSQATPPSECISLRALDAFSTTITLNHLT
jgi:hypothetical protein